MDLDVPFLKTLVFGLLSWRLNQCEGSKKGYLRL